MEENETKDEEVTESIEATKDGGKKNPMWIVVALLVILALGAYYVLSMNRSASDAATTELDSTSAESDYVIEEDAIDVDTSETIEGEATVIEIEGGAYYFEPNIIEAGQGETIRVVLTSVDMMHDFVIDELDVAVPVVQSGETGEVEFTVNLPPGEYEFYCSVGDHREQGMVGTLIVTE